MKRLTLTLCFFICYISFLSSQISRQIEEILAESHSQNAIFGISILDSSGTSLYDYNAHNRFIPASTIKVLTSLSALSILGEEYQFNTTIGHTGELLEDGTLIGDIVVRGSGDPSLGSPKYRDVSDMEEILRIMVASIMKSGIKCVEGQILADGLIFDQKPINPSWAWDDLANYYACGAWGLNFHENMYFLDFKRSEIPDQQTEIVSIYPEINELNIKNEVITGPYNSGDNAYIYGDPYGYQRWVEGTIPPGDDLFTIKGAIPNPLLFAAEQLYTGLIESGISAAGFGILQKSVDIKEIKEITSPRLIDLVKYAIEISNNLYCEAFYRAVGASSGSTGNHISGKKMLMDHFSDLNLDLSQIYIDDGSGLSSRNRVSPYFLTSFINKYRSTIGLEKLKLILPKVGEEGSVKGFLKGFSSQKFAWLKSGSINNVLAYTGLLKVKSGRTLTISVMTNGHDSNRAIRRQIQKIIEVIYQDL